MRVAALGTHSTSVAKSTVNASSAGIQIGSLLKTDNPLSSCTSYDKEKEKEKQRKLDVSLFSLASL